ncbi:N-acyl-D-amino-acid deacylase family protein [Porphyrobacter sp. CACIAM 03H1]|uniref:N-acyl-D-amino-acid deacylase family protein n=1 Tax=Porphyrobacter sp. CACIAM 03H1 TaxID=2003315 RepID=UPI000B5A6D22|nr:amidohydrolase family protein [Porphyrobacter sp. CACIAM 03H1]ASJ90324.1 amidohydrolase [Porphyrobacter sp. CACIAM 03H1]
MQAEHDWVIRAATIADGTGGDLFEGDIAIRQGRIAAIGKVAGRGAEEIDAKGKIVTPGFIDVHTHYDGQCIWAEELSPSSSHGVTSAVMGNCGVGFAPCRRADHEMLINVMEGVEDIPGVVMTEGLDWDWETFPEYLDKVAAGKRDIDVAAYLPHSPLRVYAMGARGAAREAATGDDLALMRRLTAEAMQAGALGFATSRLSIHKTADGAAIPTFDTDIAELEAIGRGMADAGAGTFQVVLDAFVGWDKEYPVIDRMIAASGRPATFTLASGNDGPPRWRRVLEMLERTNAAGGVAHAQVMPRPIGLIAGLELTVHPFVLCPSWAKIAHLPIPEQVAAMRDPTLRAALLSEDFTPGHPFNELARNWRWLFPLDNPPDYAPPAHMSMAGQAAARGCTPQEVAYDRLLATEGRGLFLAALGNYENASLGSAHEMLRHPYCVPGLGDGGAHYGAICDASYSTYLLTEFVQKDGPLKLGLAEAVHMLSAKAARAVGFADRGTLHVGGRADLNVIDLDRLTLHLPEVVRDLPAGGRRLHQRATGYEATMVAGEVIRRFDESTGARPGKLVRGSGYRAAA